MDRPAALSRLTEVSASLVPAAGVTQDDMQAAREALAASLLQHGVDPAPVLPGLPAPPVQQTGGDLSGVIDAASVGGAVPVALRRSLPAPALGNPGLTPAATAGMLPKTLGPFIDHLGAPHWVDLFPPLVQTTITRAGTATPVLVLPLAVPTGPLPTTIPVGAGTLWIAAQLLAPAAPAGSYAGIRISGGQAVFSAAATAVAGGLQIAASVTLTLAVQPDPGPAGPLGGGAPGADGGAVVAQMPVGVTIELTPTGANVTAAGDASLTAYGTTVALHWQATAAVWEAAIGQLLILYTSQPASFAVASALSTLCAPSGIAPITRAAWALPVAVAPAAQLGAAASAGSLALGLGAGLSVSWAGLTGGPAVLGAAFLLGAPGVLALVAIVKGGARLGASVALWQQAPPQQARYSTIDLSFAPGTEFYFTSVEQFAGASNVEVLTTAGSLAAHLDRPLAADGRRLGPTLPGLLVAYSTSAGSGMLLGGTRPPPTAPAPPIAVALRNALLVTTPPASLFMAGSFSAMPTELDAGALLLGFGLETVLPTLPDPYAANFLPRRERDKGQPGGPVTSVLVATTTWGTAATALSFREIGLVPDSIGVAALAATQAPPPRGDAAQEDQRRGDALAAAFNAAVGGGPPALMLLDVSSNADQLGVGVTVATRPVGVAGGGTAALSVQGLDLMARCLDLRVFTPPSVQWEPVVTIPNPNVAPFPSPVGFRDDGGPTLIGANDVTLVPVEPAPLLDHVVSAYDGGAAAGVLFTLPFGMAAVATLPVRPHAPVPPILSFRPELADVAPSFTTPALDGGRQVSLTAPAQFFSTNGQSPSLPGATVQYRNVLDASGAPQGLSILGPAVDVIFNTELNPGAPTARVPVRRIDFSGYGASSFSAWTDPAANPPAVVQVRFNIMTGRASHEVVQVKSILYPWGAIVVRTITIDRQDDSEVYRYDSGWVAATPGAFGNMPGIIVHPGAVQGAFNIREIRDTTQTYTNAAKTVQMTAVRFDADIQIAGVVSGARNGLVPSSGQLGFVQEKPIGAPITPADLAALIASQGALGGPVDCLISLGDTTQAMRVLRVEVATAPHGATDQFAATARGSVALPAQGSWSVLARTDNVSEPSPIDPDLGVALIREGAAGAPPGNTPWRLAEPVDLWTPDTPSMDFCLLHATNSTRMLFPRPKIETGAHAFTSTVAPLLADGFALMEATGICPRQDACLAFPNANQQLQIMGPGQFALAVAPNPFPPSMPSRVLAGGAAATIGFEYADENGNPCTVSVAIAPDSWAVNLKGVNVRLDMSPFDGIMRTVGDSQAASGAGVAFANSRLVLGSVLAPLQQVLTFLEALGLPYPFAMSFSNSGWSQSKKYKMKAGLQLNLPMKKSEGARFDIPTDTPIGTILIGLKIGFGNAAASEDALFTSTSQWLAYLSFKGSVQVPVFPPLPVKAGGIVIFKMEADFPAGKTTEQEKLTLQLGVIITVGGDLIPGVLSLQASVAFAFTLVVVTSPPPSIGVGVGLILSASGQILGGVVGISFTAEADGLLIFQLSPKETLVQATFDIQVDVSLCWFLDITFEVQTQYTKQIS